jgi:hypothetical protein
MLRTMKGSKEPETAEHRVTVKNLDHTRWLCAMLSARSQQPLSARSASRATARSDACTPRLCETSRSADTSVWSTARGKRDEVVPDAGDNAAETERTATARSYTARSVSTCNMSTSRAELTLAALEAEKAAIKKQLREVESELQKEEQQKKAAAQRAKDRKAAVKRR